MSKPWFFEAFSFCFYGGLFCAVLFALLILVFRSRLIPVIGGDESSFQYIYDYMLWTMIVGSIPTVGNVLCGHLVRSVGAAKEAGFGMSLGGVLNIILDPLFMFVLMPKGQEVAGAALATLISNIVSCSYLLVMLKKAGSSTPLSIRAADIRGISQSSIRQLFSVGIPFVRRWKNTWCFSGWRKRSIFPKAL